MERMTAALALVLLVALAGSGCVGGAIAGGAAMGAAAAAGGYQYVEGQYKTDYRQPYEQVYEAALASLQENDMPVTESQKDAAGASIKAKRADGTDVWVDLKRSGPEMTNATIRVGYMGDENASRAIASSIATRLGEAEAEPVGRGGE